VGEVTTGIPSVRIMEVGPRDGLQNEAGIVSTADKAEFIRRLAAAGLEDIEVTSFVRPDRVPQLADAESLLATLNLGESVRPWALVPNPKGLDRALASGITHIAVLTAASETFNRRNINMGIRESLTQIGEIVARAGREGLRVRGYVSTCWVCPYEGRIDADRVVGIVEDLISLGLEEVSIGDTIGVAAPAEVETTLGRLLARFGPERLAVHFHDTYGMAVANAHQAWRMGVTRFDSSAGGLGGCPYAPGAAGNVATEDLLYLFDRMGVETGIRLDALARASGFIGQRLGRRLPSRVLAALGDAGRAQE
jgi:hydroxymethylglutaryl-CoA lyase